MPCFCSEEFSFRGCLFLPFLLSDEFLIKEKKKVIYNCYKPGVKRPTPDKNNVDAELNVNCHLLVMQVLADSVGVPCQLVKGQQFTESDDVAMNIVKIDDGR